MKTNTRWWQWWLIGAGALALITVISLSLILRFRPQWLIAIAPNTTLVVAVVTGTPDESTYQAAEGALGRLLEFPLDEVEANLRSLLNGGGGAFFRATVAILEADFQHHKKLWSEELRDAAVSRLNDGDERVRRAAKMIYCGFTEVDFALTYFKRQQNPDGSWPAASQPLMVDYVPNEVGVTSLSLLCLLGAGYDHRMPSKYKMCAKKAIDYLLAHRQANGRLADDQCDHALATCALGEAYAMSNDPALKPIVTAAVAQIEAPKPEDVVSYAGIAKMQLQVSSLKSAMAGGLTNADLAPHKDLIEAAWPDPKHEPTWLSAPDGTAAAKCATMAYMLILLGHKPGSWRLDLLIDRIHRGPPPTLCWRPYAGYCANYAMFQVGGAPWKRWNSFREENNAGQCCGDKSTDGSWDPENPDATLGDRLGVTALRTLSLEVYYRYLPVSSKSAP